MPNRLIVVCNVVVLLVASASPACAQSPAVSERIMQITVTADRGRDVGQSFGSLFEVASRDGAFVVGAGFPNAYNTRYRADRHAVEFYIRPTDGERTFVSQELPRPNDLCGTYMYARDGVLYSTYGGVKAWQSGADQWREVPAAGGTSETMRVGDGILTFGNSSVAYNDQTVLDPPDKGSYQLFFYANGHLCFYHVNRNGRGYRLYENDEDGFSKLYACPWTPGDGEVDLSKAIVMTLPVVGETTFAWGQLRGQNITGSNIGGFYVFENGAWRMLLAPRLETSYQLYSTMAYHDMLLMGQYPTGRVFSYDGETITDLAGWPPKLDGVTGSSREAQTTAIYGGDVIVGVWPWSEVWRYNPDSKQWTFMRRMIEHPELSEAIVHPYDVENAGNPTGNQWGQRVTSLVPVGGGMFVSTSAKWPCDWDAEQFPFLAPDKWKSYGSVHRITMPGHLGATSKWTDGATRFTFIIADGRMIIMQDGKELASTVIAGPMAERLDALRDLADVRWGEGIYGSFAGPAISGTAQPE